LTGALPGDPPGTSRSGPPGDLPGPPQSGPPGGRIFSLEDRPAPALYFAAWLLALAGIGSLIVAALAEPSVGRTVLAVLGISGLGLGLATGAGYQVVARADRHPSRYRGPSPLLLFGVVLTLSALGAGLLGVAGLADGTRPFGFLLGLIVVAAGYLGCVTLFVVRTGALTWGAMGWPTESRDLGRRSLRAMGVAVAVMVPTTIAISLLGGLVALVLGVHAPSVLPEARGSMEGLAVALGAGLVAPVGEEAFFRGYALTAWLRDLEPRTAVVRSAVFFAFVHIANISADTFGEGLAQAVLEFVVILPLGLVLGWLFVRHGLVGAICGHVTYNALLLTLVLLGGLAQTGG
jgi:membrane protease YdiL (CAAX protease family)